MLALGKASWGAVHCLGLLHDQAKCVFIGSYKVHVHIRALIGNKNHTS